MGEEVTLPEISAESKARIDRMFFGCQEVIVFETPKQHKKSAAEDGRILRLFSSFVKSFPGSPR